MHPGEATIGIRGGCGNSIEAIRAVGELRVGERIRDVGAVQRGLCGD